MRACVGRLESGPPEMTPALFVFLELSATLDAVFS